jgi:hypothetical protein
MLTYSDKNECKLGLEVGISLNMQQTHGQWRVSSKTLIDELMSTTKVGSYEATINLSGKINFFVIETFTRQKLLVRSVPVPQQDISVITESEFQVNITSIPYNDPGFYNPIAIALQDFYKSSMKTVWELFEPKELVDIQNQVPEIRERAGFIKR